MEKLNMVKNIGLIASTSNLDDNKDERNLFLG